MIHPQGASKKTGWSFRNLSTGSGGGLCVCLSIWERIELLDELAVGVMLINSKKTVMSGMVSDG